MIASNETYEYEIFSGSDFRGIDLSYSKFKDCSFNPVNFSGSEIGHVEFKGCTFNGANFADSEIGHVEFKGCTFNGANFADSSLLKVDFEACDILSANFKKATLYRCKFNMSGLVGSDFTNSNLFSCDLAETDTSGVLGIPKASEFLKQFSKDDKGYLVFKSFGAIHSPPDYWVIEKGSVIEETVNPCVTDKCGSGINFGTLEHVLENYSSGDVWLCRIAFEDLPDVIIPYESKQAARCSRLTLISRLTEW